MIIEPSGHLFCYSCFGFAWFSWYTSSGVYPMRVLWRVLNNSEASFLQQSTALNPLQRFSTHWGPSQKCWHVLAGREHFLTHLLAVCVPTRTLAFSFHTGECSLNQFAGFPPLMTTWQNSLVFVFDGWSRKWMASCDAAELNMRPQIASRNVATHFSGVQVRAVAWKGVIKLWAGPGPLLFCKLASNPSSQARLFPAQGSKCHSLCYFGNWDWIRAVLSKQVELPNEVGKLREKW